MISTTTSGPVPASGVRSERLSDGLFAVLLFLGAAATICLRLEKAALGSGFETVAVARSLAATGAFANPYSSLPTGVTAHTAPLYPAFLALLLRLFGYSSGFAVATSLCSIAVHGFHAALLPRISRIFFEDRRPGIVAAALTIVLPLYFFFPQFEVIYLATALMLFCLVVYRLALAGGGGRGFVAGLAFGAVALLNPASVSVTAPWVAYAAWRYLKGRRAAFLVCLALGAVVALAPWTWRNYQQFHKLFFVRDNLGLELYVSNTDGAQASFNQNATNGLYASRHPDPSAVEAREVVRLGEMEFNRRRMASAREWMTSHPGRFLALSAARARMFWFPDAEGYPFYALGVAMVTVGSALGFLLMAVRRKSILLFLLSTQLFYPVMYYLVQNDPRFRAPILWVSLLGTGYLAVAGWNRLRARSAVQATASAPLL